MSSAISFDRAEIAFGLFGWLVGWLVGWSVGWLVGFFEYGNGLTRESCMTQFSHVAIRICSAINFDTAEIAFGLSSFSDSNH